MDKKVILSILSGKGGVGKSYLSINIFDAFKTNLNSATVAFDNDSGSPVLSHYKAINARHIQLFDLDSEGEPIPETEDYGRLNCVAEEIENSKETNQIVLVDNGSSSFYGFLGWFDGATADAFNRSLEGFHLICIIPVTSSANTLKSAVDVLKTYGKSASYIIVENEIHGSIDFDTTPAYNLFKEIDVNFQFLKLKKPTKSVLSLVEKVRDLYLLPSEAIEDKRFSLIEKSRIQSYFMNFQDGFLNAFERILNGRK